jgi:hypothetical protein
MTSPASRIPRRPGPGRTQGTGRPRRIGIRGEGRDRRSGHRLDRQQVHRCIGDDQGRDSSGAVSSSVASTERLRAHWEFRSSTAMKWKQLAVYIDGADEIDGRGYMIKGGGAALTREKIVAAQSRKRFVCIADASKLVNTLGAFPVADRSDPDGVEARDPAVRSAMGGHGTSTGEGRRASCYRQRPAHRRCDGAAASPIRSRSRPR